MKHFKHILLVILASLMLLGCFCGCSTNDFALKIGDTKISKRQYEVIARSLKSQYITENNLEETDDLWDKYVDQSYSATMQQHLDSIIQTYIIKYNLYSQHFDELGLKLDSDVVEKIQKTITTLENQYGGHDTFVKSLKKQGFDYDQFVEEYYNEAKEEAIILYYFGPDSTVDPTPRDEIKAYYNEYYTNVKHIFFSTKDDEDNDFSKSEKSKIGQKAQSVYERVQNGEDFDTLLKEFNEDPGMTTNPDGYVFSKDDTSFVQLFRDTAFELKSGETKLIQTYMGYHIIKKYPFTDQNTFTAENERMLIENMKSVEASDLLDDLKEKIGVTYNNTVLEELSVKNLPRVNNKEDQLDDLKDQLQDAADQDVDE